METSVQIVVSDPWEYRAENGGDPSLLGTIESITRLKRWVVRLERPAYANGRAWPFAICQARYKKPLSIWNRSMQPAGFLFVENASPDADSTEAQLSAEQMEALGKALGSVLVLKPGKKRPWYSFWS